MSPFGSNVAKCHKCLLREGGNCSVDGRDIIAHARAGECPHPDGPRFTEVATETPAKSRGLGDTISRITHALGIPECGGCAKRRAALNRLMPYRESAD